MRRRLLAPFSVGLMFLIGLIVGALDVRPSAQAPFLVYGSSSGAAQVIKATSNALWVSCVSGCGGSPTLPFELGANTPSGDDTALLIARNATGVGPHGIRDESAITAAADAAGSATVDSLPAVGGTTAYSHVAGFQARANYTGSNTLAEWRGFWALPTLTGTGVIDSSKQFMVNDPGVSGGGSITHNYGLFIAYLSKGTSDNYAIYTLPNGSSPGTQSLFSGRVRIGLASTSTGTAATDGHFSIEGFATNQRLLFGYQTTGEYGWIQAAKFGVAFEPLVLNANGGGVAIGTAAVTANSILTVSGGIVATSLRGAAVAFASVPATPVEGMLVAVTDSSTAVWGATITGSGANHVLAYYNGTNWTVAGK